MPTWAGFIYLDVWSRRIVGWSIGERMTGDLVLAALNMAFEQRRPSQDVVHHSDQGRQYTAIEFGQRCKEMGVRPSMGTVGDAYDNAMAESFFASLECELIDRRSFQTPANFERSQQVPAPSSAEHGLPTVGVYVACATPPVDSPAWQFIEPA